MQTTANGPEGQTEWNTVNWREVNRNVRNLRRRIFRASQQGDHRKVASLQKLMLRSYSNRLHAVRRVTQTNQGKRTPGVDKVLVKTPKARGKLVDELGTYQPWRAKPTKRVYIPKANGKLRPLGIPTIRDRALQAIVKNVLEPSWEAKFEATSYGFRPGRGCHDAIERIRFTTTGRGRRKRWAIDADIKGAFDNIDHEYLLETIGPVPGKELIRQWLKAGYVDKNVFHSTEAGTPQGGVISPLLANIALHGLEEALGVTRNEKGTITSKYVVVRYADDFVILCQTKEEAEGIMPTLIEWLAQRGLTLSTEKTRIVHLSEGIDFLGFTIRWLERQNRLQIAPSKAAMVSIRARLKAEWKTFRGYNVVAIANRLNPIIRGWANYYRRTECSKAFSSLDWWMFQKEKRWVGRQHPTKMWYWQRDKYWGTHRIKHGADRWVFQDKRTGTAVLKFAWQPRVTHILIRGGASPDDPDLQSYWKERQKSSYLDFSPGQRKMAEKQGYICPQCGEWLLNGEELNVHHIQPRKRGGSNALDNLTLRHLYCHQQIHSTRDASNLLEPDAL